MANPKQTSYSPGPRRILIVDDSSLVRLYYRETLEKAGFATDQAINGIKAMEKVLAHVPGVVYAASVIQANPFTNCDGLVVIRGIPSS